jgi:hypothetical protein
MQEDNPIRRLRRRLEQPPAPDFAPWDEPVESSGLLGEIADIAVAGGVAR